MNHSPTKSLKSVATAVILLIVVLALAVFDENSEIRPPQKKSLIAEIEDPPANGNVERRTSSQPSQGVENQPNAPTAPPTPSTSHTSNPWQTTTLPVPNPEASEVEKTARNHLRGLRNAMIAYQGSFDALVEALPCPAGDIGRAPMQWTGTCVQDWDEIGWSPAGRQSEEGFIVTDCQYSIELYEEIEGFVAVARCDEDLDGIIEEYFVDFEP